LPLQNLHHRLLDEAIQYGWDVGGILHLMQLALGIMDGDGPNWRPIVGGGDPICCRW
jgi:hypothetical protein